MFDLILFLLQIVQFLHVFAQDVLFEKVDEAVLGERLHFIEWLVSVSLVWSQIQILVGESFAVVNFGFEVFALNLDIKKVHQGWIR